MQKIESNQTTELNGLDKDKALQFLTGISRVARLFLGILFIIGLGITIFGVKLIGEAYESQNWPSVQGKIISSTLERERTRGKIGYRARIQYAYKVDGKRFLGNRIALGPLIGLFRPSDKHPVRKYPKGTIVTVYYDPTRPERSILEPGFNPNIILIAILGPFIILCSVVLFGNLKRFKASVRSKLNLPDEKDLLPKMPIQQQPPSYERTRIWIIVLLSALLVALLLVQFYGDEINKWYENIRKELGFEENSKNGASDKEKEAGNLIDFRSVCKVQRLDRTNEEHGILNRKLNFNKSPASLFRIHRNRSTVLLDNFFSDEKA